FEFLADIKGGPTRFSPSKIRDLPDFIACVFGLCLGIILADWTLILMKVLLADDRQGHRDSLRRLIQRDPEVQVSGIAEDAENAPGSVIARELRRTLDGCPVCDEIGRASCRESGLRRDGEGVVEGGRGPWDVGRHV